MVLFVTAFLPRSKHLLISWLQSPSAMILVQKIKMSAQVGSSIPLHPAFFMAQLSHPSMTSGKTIALTIQPFVKKVMSLLYNMLSSFDIAFLPRSKHLLIMAAVTICCDFGAQKNKISHCFHCFPTYLSWSDGIKCHDLGFSNVEF